MTCHHCGAHIDNGLALCELCQRKASTILEYLPIYFRNLARWHRPNRPNGSLGSSGSWLLRRGETTGADRIGAALDLALTMLLDHAATLTKARYFPRPLTYTDAVLRGDVADAEAEALIDDPARWVTALCRGFDEHLVSIATLDWCSQFVTDLAEHDVRLCALTETAVPGWYAGACRVCSANTYVVPGLTWLTCRRCGTTTAARDHVELVLDEARDWIAPPKRIAEAIVALVDTEQSVPKLHERIKKWQQRERLVGIRRLDSDGDEVGPKRYRLGDVLDVLLVDGATRPGASLDTTAS